MKRSITYIVAMAVLCLFALFTGEQVDALSPPAMPKAFYQGIEGSFDFTGTDFDTVAELNEAGVSGTGISTVAYAGAWYGGSNNVEGSWNHTAGSGWNAVPEGSPSAYGGPHMLLPVQINSGNIECDLEFSYSPAGVAEQFGLKIAFVGSNLSVMTAAFIYDLSGASSNLATKLFTSNNSGAFTERYGGSSFTPSGNQTIKLRALNGTIGIWDQQDQSWHNHTGPIVYVPQVFSYIMVMLHGGSATGVSTNFKIRSIDYFHINPDGNRIDVWGNEVN